jgi:hypothetical protein
MKRDGNVQHLCHQQAGILLVPQEREQLHRHEALGGVEAVGTGIEPVSGTWREGLDRKDLSLQ